MNRADISWRLPWQSAPDLEALETIAAARRAVSWTPARLHRMRRGFPWQVAALLACLALAGCDARNVYRLPVKQSLLIGGGR